MTPLFTVATFLFELSYVKSSKETVVAQPSAPILYIWILYGVKDSPTLILFTEVSLNPPISKLNKAAKRLPFSVLFSFPSKVLIFSASSFENN